MTGLQIPSFKSFVQWPLKFFHSCKTTQSEASADLDLAGVEGEDVAETFD